MKIDINTLKSASVIIAKHMGKLSEITGPKLASAIINNVSLSSKDDPGMLAIIDMSKCGITGLFELEQEMYTVVAQVSCEMRTKLGLEFTLLDDGKVGICQP